MSSKKSQLIFIHGGDAHNTTEEYLDSLRNCNWDLTKRYPDWKKWISDGLSDTCESLKPSMPDTMNAYYPAWKIWFEKYFQYLGDEKLILVGHSLGGIFLTKYLSENTLPRKIDQLHLVSAVYDDEGLVGESTASFTIDESRLHSIAPQCREIHLYHSTDDGVVPYSHALKYQKSLECSLPLSGAIILHTFEDRGHFFGQSHFIELFSEIWRVVK